MVPSLSYVILLQRETASRSAVQLNDRGVVDSSISQNGAGDWSLHRDATQCESLVMACVVIICYIL